LGDLTAGEGRHRDDDLASGKPPGELAHERLRDEDLAHRDGVHPKERPRGRASRKTDRLLDEPAAELRSREEARRDDPHEKEDRRRREENEVDEDAREQVRPSRRDTWAAGESLRSILLRRRCRRRVAQALPT